MTTGSESEMDSDDFYPTYLLATSMAAEILGDPIGDDLDVRLDSDYRAAPMFQLNQGIVV